MLHLTRYVKLVRVKRCAFVFIACKTKLLLCIQSAVRDAAAKSAAKEYAGWLDRILDIQGIEKTTLTSIHGFLIAQGLIRFEFNGRSVGLQYQISTQGREAMARESVYLSDDPHRSESMADNESISQAA